MRKIKPKEIFLSTYVEEIHKHGHHGGVQPLSKFFCLKFAIVCYSLIDQVQIVVISVVFSLLSVFALLQNAIQGMY